MSNLQKIILTCGILFLASGAGIMIYGRWASGAASQAVQTAEMVEALRRLDEAEEYLRQNSSDAARQAVVIFNRVRSLNLSKNINQRATYGLGLALEKIDDQSAALEHYRTLKLEGVEETDLADRVDYSLGKLLLYINHEEEGRSLLETLLARTRDNRLKSRIHTAFGNYYLRRGDNRRSRENFTVALKYFPENLQAELGRAQSVRGHRGAALSYEYYDDYLTGNSRLQPQRRGAVVNQVRQDLYNSGIRAYRSGNYHDAIYYLKKLLANYSDSPVAEKAQYWLGESYLSSGQENLALDAFRSVTVNTDTEMDQAAHLKTGIVLFRQGKIEEAGAIFNKAANNYPGGAYTDKAQEWQRECEDQIREKSQMDDYLNRTRSNENKPSTESQPQRSSRLDTSETDQPVP